MKNFAEINIDSVEVKNKLLSVRLEDGRLISYPIKNFPEIRKMPVSKRKDLSITGEKYFNTFLMGNSGYIYVLTDDFNIIRE